MYRSSLVLAIALVGMLAQFAKAGDCCCPQCGVKVCRATPEKSVDKKSCFEVECKDICIPRIRFPWQMCCPPQCGRVKTVKVLKKKDYECERCGYKWEIKCVSCGNSGCNGGGSGSGCNCSDCAKSAKRSTPAVAKVPTAKPGLIDRVSQQPVRQVGQPTARPAFYRTPARPGSRQALQPVPRPTKPATNYDYFRR